MPTALLSTFVHKAWSKNGSTTFQWWSYCRPPVNETECVCSDHKSLRQKSDLLKVVSARWHDVDCKRELDCRVLTLFSCSVAPVQVLGCLWNVQQREPKDSWRFLIRRRQSIQYVGWAAAFYIFTHEICFSNCLWHTILGQWRLK